MWKNAHVQLPCSTCFVQDLQPHVRAIICQLQPHLAALTAAPPQSHTHQSTPARALPVDDRLYGYEAAGQLLAGQTVDAEDQRALLALVLAPIDARLSGSDPPELQHAYEALTRLCKGFTLQLATQARPFVGEALVAALKRCVVAAARVPLHKGVRARLISLLHRLLECVGQGMAPQLPAVVDVLLHAGADAGDLADTLSLVGQLVARLDVDLLGQMIVACIARCLPDVLACEGGGARDGGPGATVETQREARELQRSFYLFVARYAILDHHLSH